jgi:hypothetical protein
MKLPLSKIKRHYLCDRVGRWHPSKPDGHDRPDTF